jgi:hypothetical protein
LRREQEKLVQIPNKLIAKKARRKGMKYYKLSRSNAGFYPADFIGNGNANHGYAI